MRGKKAKLLRKLVSNLGFEKVEMKVQTIISTDIFGNTYEIPLTFRYPDKSFQRVYKDLKKGVA